jgi:hypothetical protein
LEEQMLEVSTSARERLAGILDGTDTGDDQCIRLTATEQGELALTVDRQHEGDRVVEHGDREVLLVPAAVDAHLEGAVLTVSGEHQDQLTVQPKDAVPRGGDQNGTR